MEINLSTSEFKAIVGDRKAHACKAAGVSLQGGVTVCWPKTKRKVNLRGAAQDILELLGREGAAILNEAHFVAPTKSAVDVADEMEASRVEDIKRKWMREQREAKIEEDKRLNVW